MKNNYLKKPSNRFHQFLIWAYKPRMKNIENIDSEKKDKNVDGEKKDENVDGEKEDEDKLRVTGYSPLDIPARTMILSFIAAIVIAIIIGNIFMTGLYWYMESYDLPKIEEKPIQLKEGISKDKILVDLLLPHLTQRLNAADTIFRKKLAASFPEGKIAISHIAKYLNISDTIALKHEILGGPFKREGKLGYLIPSFEPISADKLADKYGLFKSYNEDIGETHEDTWNRIIFIGAVQSLRTKLNGGITYPRRLLQALGGGIQWITFITAIWCMILLVFLRIPWAKLQTTLVVEKKLPWHSEDKNIWDINATQSYWDINATQSYWDINATQSYFDELDNKKHYNYPRMFIPVRLIKSVINIKKSDKSLSVYQIIRERIDSYRNAIDIGEYEIINFLLWATPTFGFIGTIFGIISAMENAASIFAAATPIEQSIALDKVSSSLGTAFDTSFVALISLVPMSFFLARSRKVEANLFEELEMEAVNNLPFLIGATETTETTETTEATETTN